MNKKNQVLKLWNQFKKNGFEVSDPLFINNGTTAFIVHSKLEDRDIVIKDSTFNGFDEHCIYFNVEDEKYAFISMLVLRKKDFFTLERRIPNEAINNVLIEVSGVVDTCKAKSDIAMFNRQLKKDLIKSGYKMFK